MALSRTERYWTADDLEELPDDGNRYEVIDGVLYVTPSPNEAHQDAAFLLAHLIADYAWSVGLHVRMAPSDVRFSDERLVQPDVLVLPCTSESGKPPAFREVGRLQLVLEALSPGTARVDRGVKRALYQEEGVSEYWILDATARCFERWRPGDSLPVIETEVLTWNPVAGHAPFRLDVAAFFRRVWGD